MKLDDVVADVVSQLDDQERLGAQVTRVNDIPEKGPTNKGLWYQISDATAVFADLKQSTAFSIEGTPKAAVYAYTYFIRAMALVLERSLRDWADWTRTRSRRYSGDRTRPRPGRARGYADRRCRERLPRTSAKSAWDKTRSFLGATDMRHSPPRVQDHRVHAEDA